jgi:hypothetical protein
LRQFQKLLRSGAVACCGEMKLRRRTDPVVDPELEATRRALLAVVAEIGARLEAVEVQGRQTQELLVKLPPTVGWASRFLSDAEEKPELLEALASEVAAFKLERPAEFTNMLTRIGDNAHAA